MPRTVREKRLDSPAARAKLKHSGKPYWRAIDTGLHLGYRKGLNGGRWVLRRYLGAGQYEVATIAIADDHSPADGASILDFFQAQRKAREVAALAKAPAKTAFTVAAAMDAYFERLEHEGSRSLADAKRRARFHILPGLGDILVADLTRDIISKWLTGMAGKGADGHSSQDAIRANRASANRVLTILRAALNQAFRDGKAASDIPWRTVQPFREVDSPRLRYFTKDEVTRLINSAQGNFRDLVKAALFTGCRYSELGRLRAGDFNPDSGTVFVGQSKSGKAQACRPDRRRPALFRNAHGGPSWRCLDAHPCGRSGMGTVASNPADGGNLPGRADRTGGWLPYFAAHGRVASGHVRRAVERCCAQSWPCGHADDGKALRPFRAVLYRRNDPQVCAGIRDGG